MKCMDIILIPSYWPELAVALYRKKEIHENILY